MKISITELKQIFENLISKIEHNLGDDFEFNEEEYYWDVLENKIFKIDENIDIDNLSIGQISDDWFELQRLCSSEEIPISYDLVRLAYLLIAIREKSTGKW